jgi:hypothetical protein
MNAKARVPFEPGFDLGMPMSGVIVNNQIRVRIGQRFGIDLLQEFNPFLVSMLRHAFGDNRALGQFNCCEQCRGSGAFVVVCHRLQATGEDRQALLRTIERLNLALFITRQHLRVLGRIQVQAHYIDQLFGETWVVRDFKRLRTMRLQAVVFPNSLHHRNTATQALGQRSRRPLSCILRRLLCCLANDLGLERSPLRGRRPSASRCILLNDNQMVRHKAIALGANRSSLAPQLRGDILALATLGTRQHIRRSQNPISPACYDLAITS